ncbi:MAG: histidine kinase, partial [Desulfuromonadales bacterium]
MNQREKLLEQLTGVDSSKLNYYVELKKRNQEVLKQNRRLEILQQLTRDINIDMSIEDIIERAFSNLPETLPCDFLGLVT